MDLTELKQLCYGTLVHADTDDVKVSLETGQLSPFLRSLPRTTRNLHVTLRAESKSRNLNLTEIQFLQKLESLWLVEESVQPAITSAWGYLLESYYIVYEHVSSEPLTSFRELHIHAHIHDSRENLKQLVMHGKYIEVLDIHRLSELKTNATIASFLIAIKDNPVKVLNLDRYQYLEKKYNIEFDPSIELQTLVKAPFQCLTLRHNGLIYLKPGLSQVAPHMRVIDLSYNLFHGLVSQAAFVELGFHPQLEVITIQVEGTFQNTIRPADRYDHTEYSEKAARMMMGKSRPNGRHKMDTVNPQHATRSKRHTDYKTKLLQCMTHFDTDMIHVLGNKTLFCLVLGCFHNIFKLLPCNVLPDPQKLIGNFDFECSPPFPMSFGGNLKEVFLNYWSLPIIGLPVSKLQNTCFRQNNLTVFQFSNSPLAAKSVYLSNFLQFHQVRGMDHLETLDFSYNQIEVSILHSPLLKSMSGLRTLKLQGNFINVSNSNHTLCEHLPQLHYIDLSQGQIKDISENALTSCKYLHHIDLSGNQLTDTKAVINIPSQLTYLNLSHNRIRMLSQDFWTKVKSMTGKLDLDLCGNELVCDCSMETSTMIQTIQLMNSSNIQFSKKNNYMCIVDDVTRLRIVDIDLNSWQSACKHSVPAYVWVLITLVGILAIVAFLIYKFRFKLKMWYYRFKVTMYQNNQRAEQSKYDAFVSYCAEDRFWVHNRMLKILEDRYGFRLCIHYRDFVVGETTADQIVSCMSQSKINIAVISDDFLAKVWPIFELKLMHQYFVEKHQPYLILQLGAINRPSECSLVQQIIQDKTQVPVSSGNQEDDKREELFWHKLMLNMFQYTEPQFLKCLRLCCRQREQGEYELLEDGAAHESREAGDDDVELLQDHGVEKDQDNDLVYTRTL